MGMEQGQGIGSLKLIPSFCLAFTYVCCVQEVIIDNRIFIKAQLATARAPLCDGTVHLFVRLFVCLSPKCVHKNAIL